ncbi:MAG: hypothetical protein ACXVJT_05850 [Thermoanaerobaculia bacterium]
MSRWQWWLPVVLIAALALAAVAPIRSYDFFWHLATGRWITEHLALPLFDPFAVASDRTPWINGEWLWQIGAFTVFRIGGLDAVTWVRAIVVAATFAFGYAFARREDFDPVALIAVAIAFAGAHDRLDARPSTSAAMLVVLAIAIASRRTGRMPVILYAILTIAWINVHPSAILAPVIALILRREPLMPFVSAFALLVNPFGWRGIVSPIELTAYAGSGAFVNAEWLPSPPLLFPILYLSVAIALVVFAVAEQKREQIWRFALLAIFATLAIRHVRNQGLYFAAFPLLITPMARPAMPRRLLAFSALVIIVLAGVTTPHATGVDDNRFPVRSVETLQRSPFQRGNFYNPDQFGGFLIWSFYPQRRTLTDGRNELYHRYNEEYARARLDGREWQALLRKYRVDLAVDEYRRPLDTIDAITRQHRTMPASLAYFPRRDWALIAYDRAAMVFVRRAAFPAADVERFELKGVVPDR